MLLIQQNKDTHILGRMFLENMKNNLIVAIDDVHPEEGWGVEGDTQIDYLKSLNEKFGVKFNLFIPSYYHNKYIITKDFIDFWKQYDWIEMSNHGHYHACKNETIEMNDHDGNKIIMELGEMEFLELNYKESLERLQDSMNLWKKCGYTPRGFRAPGWGVNPASARAIGYTFDWVAGHDEINDSIKWNCRFFTGSDGIQEEDNINLYNNNFMFQSHINGKHNDNVWSEENFLHFENVLEYLLSEYTIDFKTISEIL